MKIYFAPLEGITGYIYRNIYENHFGKGRIDKYFTPFIVPKEKTFLTTKEIKDISMDHNQGMEVVPQILTNDVRGFLQTAHALKEQGYDTVNLNLGCPAGTVVSKGRGSGFLNDTKKLDEFFSQVMEQTPVKVSIKTRIGKEFPEEIEDLTEIFNKYKFEEWIIHPRVREDFYKNTPNMNAFTYAFEHSKNNVCYNGDIFTVADYQKIVQEYPSLGKVMLGRGVVANPGLIGEIHGNPPMTKDDLYHFLNNLRDAYLEELSGEKDVLFRVKELWAYMQTMFDEQKKDWKRIRKAQTLDAYQDAMEHLLETCKFIEDAGFTATMF